MKFLISNDYTKGSIRSLYVRKNHYAIILFSKKTNKSLCKTVHPYAGELLIISVLFQIDQMSKAPKC